MRFPLAPFGICLAVAAGHAEVDEAQVLRRSLVSLGDPARLQGVMARARRGGPLTVAVIGGSITAGARAGSEEKRWGNLVAAWWRDSFPAAEVTFVNAGIGATGSPHGAHRVKAHLLDRHPDFVVVEYAVNDADNQLYAETYEGLLRQILKQPGGPAVMLLFTMHNNGGNAQAWQEMLGRHYGLPMVSMRDALWPEIAAGRLAWDDVEDDLVHPNDRGHAYCASFLTAVLGRVRRNLPPDDAPAEITPLPPPMLTDEFEHATFYNADTTAPTASRGFERGGVTPFGPQWEADTPGDFLQFEVEGTTISVLFHRIKQDQGNALARVDDEPPVRLDGWFDADWGGYSAWEVVARGLPPGKHRLRIEVLPETAPESHGHAFQVRAIFVAGRPD